MSPGRRDPACPGGHGGSARAAALHPAQRPPVVGTGGRCAGAGASPASAWRAGSDAATGRVTVARRAGHHVADEAPAGRISQWSPPKADARSAPGATRAQAPFSCRVPAATCSAATTCSPAASAARIRRVADTSTPRGGRKSTSCQHPWSFSTGATAPRARPTPGRDGVHGHRFELSAPVDLRRPDQVVVPDSGRYGRVEDRAGRHTSTGPVQRLLRGPVPEALDIRQPVIEGTVIEGTVIEVRVEQLPDGRNPRRAARRTPSGERRAARRLVASDQLAAQARAGAVLVPL